MTTVYLSRQSSKNSEGRVTTPKALSEVLLEEPRSLVSHPYLLLLKCRKCSVLVNGKTNLSLLPGLLVCGCDHGLRRSSLNSRSWSRPHPPTWVQGGEQGGC